MKLSRIGQISMALAVSVAIGLGMTACGGGTIGFMWVLGTQFNQIAGFKIDDFTGNLTNTVGSPYGSGGTNPVSIVVKPGGRYVYVINQDDTVSVRPIQIGPIDGAQAQVISGLSAGDRVVTDGTDRLRDGQKVTIPPPPSKTASSPAQPQPQPQPQQQHRRQQKQ